ncbi:MAG TPA: YHS domain-containing protein [Gemmataceae bacterium]|jgi:YHS domain-containing protein|nr:YHS domain-containing protein [Gemmataceae bacterium]
MRLVAVVSLLAIAVVIADGPKEKPAREALKPLNILIGSWKGTGSPEGSLEEKQKGHWQETVACEWQFKDADAWLVITFDKGKYFTRGEARYLAAKDRFQLTLTTVAKEKLVYEGTLTAKQFVVERPLVDAKQVERLTFSLLHDNRVTYRLETRPEGGTAFTKKYVVGMTKEGEAFADVGRGERECIVSGGTGTIQVSFEGKTYYVCCTGCRDEFKANPAKYVKEWEAKHKK